MSNISCNKCGKDIPHGSTFCSLCGAYQATSADSSNQYPSSNSEQKKPPQQASLKETILGGYVAIGIVYTLHGWLFGSYSYKGFMYNFGRALIWPALMFSELGKFLTAVILVIVIAALLLFKR